MLILSQYANDN